ncbi:hypothetical protein M413DRAFT_447986 [Hebeloma cylindrosporum]|uniref:F-box domain-containing protein n=1 Tax=Hebeloma cylindrosporum TaxID=76867 RepID=A0A0C3BNL0_HEBCY|nr:hypothetical protein M413DRAFT_447986 [Hebeloma cylindrosporum h7]
MSRLSRIFKPGRPRLGKLAREQSPENDAPQSQFPVEILDQIFHNLADETPEITLGLMLMSRFFYKSLELRLYEAIILIWGSTARSFLETIQTKPPKYLETIKALYISPFVDRELASQIIQLCPAVTDFACFFDNPTKLINLCDLRPRCLSILNTQGRGTNELGLLNKSFFASVTHLSIAEEPWIWSQWYWPILWSMKNLKHLQFYRSADEEYGSVYSQRGGVRDVLTVLALEVVLIRVLDVPSSPFEGLRLFGDARVVVMELAHPKYARREFWADVRGKGCWAKAESIVEAQKRQVELNKATKKRMRG